VSISQIIDLFIQLGIIAPDKVAAAKAAIAGHLLLLVFFQVPT